ncbi:endonuclease [Flavobacterium luteum]|uniref:T9SS type A sorting domain-containing protein n=1 Tax=Flavobacterium luteum TaxID=2026654 RepID=A0A7J5AJ48_9FLAO|nr:endonuclease [Flavobacterium luteum]KAB1157641.1 T9SS type A sorting domain-containing protein [Flavobacterium luteum]
MKKLIIPILLLCINFAYSQAGAPATPYYNGFNFNQTGLALKQALAKKITETHTYILTYAQAENAIRFTDLDPDDATKTNLLLVYGFSPSICDGSEIPLDENDHRRRNKNDDGTGSCQWNREHTYARSLGTPNLEFTEANSDVHHLRPSDVERNADRGSEKFGIGSGNSGTVGNEWYPGDEWKGDIARMMMYMYLRYGDQCLPGNVGVGKPVANDPAMIDLFLNWNAEDPVSQFEDNRNTYLGNVNNFYAQGNRNPFIDNPYLATLIWGGTKAENRWPNVLLSTINFDLFSSLVIYPNPTSNNKIDIKTETILDEITLININGQLIQQIKNPILQNNTYSLENLTKGFYFLKLTSNKQSVTKKVIVN